MKLAEATRLVGRLKNAFPRMTLDEPEMELLIREVVLLADPLVLNAAVDRIIRTSDRFPSIAQIRAQYRACNEASRAGMPSLPSGPREPMPEWVHVWFWQMHRTSTERLIPGTPGREKRQRDFPQFEHPGPDAYTIPEYETIRDEWVAADSPRIRNIAAIVGKAI